ncbi:MAG: chemotaxis response regulator protein-glutamate methylesterase [Candidatus Eremiobacteraeota bacterium]|nr:chemotaxis response regulator protein-glutamate methylesterase [Candidatus Eremiobacteraeota bacterium]
MPVNVLVVDDSAFMRRAITKMLEGDPEIVVCGTARNGEDAIEKATDLNPDVITMDVEMPGMGGLEAVRHISAHQKIPIIMVSALTREGAETTFRALDLGAVDFVPKPDSAYVDMKDVALELIDKVKVFARRVERRSAERSAPPVAVERRRYLVPPARIKAVREDVFECVAIGTSTGGPVALSHIIPRMPADFPVPIVVVQHMPAGFTRPLADRLNAQSALEVHEAEDGMVMRAGLVVIARAGRQIELQRTGRGVEVVLRTDGASSLHVPSVDYLTRQVAQAYGRASLGVILTGMGADGVAGLRELKAAGGYVVGQDEASCVVYGMPRAAATAGLVDRVASLAEMPQVICALTNASPPRS